MRPVINPNQKNVNVVMPKITAVAPASASNSSLIDSKKAPKLYAVPSVTAEEMNAATTTSQARRESVAAPEGISGMYVVRSGGARSRISPDQSARTPTSTRSSIDTS